MEFNFRSAGLRVFNIVAPVTATEFLNSLVHALLCHKHTTDLTR